MTLTSEEIQLLKELKFNRLSIDLSKEQRHFIDLALEGHNVLVDACIGSGKTTSIQALCDMYDADKSILYLTYNKLLKVEAKSKIKNSNVVVSNYHGFVYPYLMRHRLNTSVERSIQTFLEHRLPIKHFDLLIVDEYQDVNDVTTQLLEYIKQQNPKMQIVVVGDYMQKLHDNTTVDVRKWLPTFLGDYVSVDFTTCFRLNNYHARKIGQAWNKNIVGLNHDQKIRFVSIDQAISMMSLLKPSEVLVLGKNNGDRTRALNILETKFPDKFNKHSIYSTIRDSDSAIDPSDDTFIFTTYDASKGLERDYCFVFDFNDFFLRVRRGMSDVNQQVINNLFLVAASRGKKEILFVVDSKLSDSTNKLTSRYPMSDEIGLIPISKFDEIDEVNMFSRPSPVTSLFDYKYEEHIEACRQMLTITEIDRELSTIDIERRDANLDLSASVGEFANAVFFSDIDIRHRLMIMGEALNSRNVSYPYVMSSLDFQLSKDKGGSYEEIRLNPVKFGMPYKVAEYQTDFNHDDRDLQWELLVLATMETGDYRYIREITNRYVTPEQSAQLVDRISSELSTSDPHELLFRIKESSDVDDPFEIIGILDAIHDDVVYELKFTSEISTLHLLQCAMYLILTGLRVGRVWNLRTNQMIEITIKDRREFLNRVIKCATKGRKSVWSMKENENGYD